MELALLFIIVQKLKSLLMNILIISNEISSFVKSKMEQTCPPVFLM